MGSIIFIKLFENRYLCDAEWEVVVLVDAGKLVLPVLVFRFQNVRSPKYSDFTVLVPHGPAPGSPSAKAAVGLRPPVCVQNTKGF